MNKDVKTSGSDPRTGPMITTIIPTYRRPVLLKRAIRSALNQTYKNLQVCVYDNASGDETAEVVAAFAKEDPRVRYYCHSENIGGMENFLYGMKQVETPFFSFLSDDDVILPEFYQNAMESFEKYHRAIFVACATISMKDDGAIRDVSLLRWTREGCYSPPDGFFEVLNNLPIWTGILFRHEVMEKVGFFNKNVGACADYDYELRIAARFPIVINKKISAIITTHSDSLSAGTFSRLDGNYPSRINVMKNLVDDKKIPVDVRGEIRDVFTEHNKKGYYQLALGLIIKHGDFDEALRTADVLEKHFNAPGMVKKIRLLTRLCSTVRPAHELLQLINKARVYRSRKKLKDIEAEYSKYVKGVLD